nr:hypothetical protein [uncultured Campylobacter sp.]
MDGGILDEILPASLFVVEFCSCCGISSLLETLRLLVRFYSC